jgi:hypothetical protein
LFVKRASKLAGLFIDHYVFASNATVTDEDAAAASDAIPEPRR